MSEPIDFQKHKSALCNHLLQHLKVGDDNETAAFSKFSRTLSEGLQKTALSIGASGDFDFESKGQILSIVALMEGAVSDAFSISSTRENDNTTPFDDLERQ